MPPYKRRRLERERIARVDEIRCALLREQCAEMEDEIHRILASEANRVHVPGTCITAGVH